jgi:hypothetical protein
MPRQVLRVLSDHLAALGTRLGWPGKVTRLRWIVARHVPARLALGGVLAVGSLLAVRAEQRDAVAERDRWGAAVAVLVARVEIVAGTPLSTELVELRRLPAALVPAGALAVLSGNDVAADRLSAGEVVLAHHTSSGPGIAARLAPGTAGVGVPLAALTFVPQVGDTVTLVGTADEVGLDGTGGVGGTVEPTDGEVIAVDDAAILVSVPLAAAPGLVKLSVNGRIGLLLRRAPGQ